MIRRRSLGLFACMVALSVFVLADPLPEWKDYENPLVGIRLSVKRSWTEIFIKETKDTGSVAFRISQEPFVAVTASRAVMEYPFEVWVSSDVLLQLYEPGYKRYPPEVFAGHKSVKIIGHPKGEPDRRDESYFSAEGAFVDQISFVAPEDYWATAEDSFTPIRKSIRWLR